MSGISSQRFQAEVSKGGWEHIWPLSASHQASGCSSPLSKNTALGSFSCACTCQSADAHSTRSDVGALSPRCMHVRACKICGTSLSPCSVLMWIACSVWEQCRERESKKPSSPELLQFKRVTLRTPKATRKRGTLLMMMMMMCKVAGSLLSSSLAQAPTRRDAAKAKEV